MLELFYYRDLMAGKLVWITVLDNFFYYNMMK